MVPHGPAFPREPDMEVEESGSMGEGSDGMALCRDTMLVDLVVEGLAEGNGVAGAILGRRALGMVW